MSSAAFALSLIFVAGTTGCFCTTMTPCFAQPQYLAPPPGVSSDQGSTVPPEVVPLVAPPAPAGLSATEGQLGANAPGLTTPELAGAGPSTALGGIQTAQQGRQAALNGLMGNQPWTPQLNEDLQAQARAQSASTGAPTSPNSSPLLAANGTSSGGTQPGQPGQNMNQAQNMNDYSDSQTLTGGVKYQQYYQNTQRSGFTNAASGEAALMAPYAQPGRISTVWATSGLGLPFFLLGATGLGIRNGFRW